MQHEPAKEEALVGTSFGLCDYMRTVEAKGAEPNGGHEILFFKVY